MITTAAAVTMLEKYAWRDMEEHSHLLIQDYSKVIPLLPF
jgi:hypothetical protein